MFKDCSLEENSLKNKINIILYHMDPNLTTILSIVWISLPIITIYYRNLLYNKYPILFYILVLFSLFSIILFTYLGYIFYPERRAGILKRKRNNNE